MQGLRRDGAASDVLSLDAPGTELPRGAFDSTVLVDPVQKTCEARGASLDCGQSSLELQDDRIQAHPGFVLEPLERALDGVLHVKSPHEALGVVRPGDSGDDQSVLVTDGDSIVVDPPALIVA